MCSDSYSNGTKLTVIWNIIMMLLAMAVMLTDSIWPLTPDSSNNIP